MPMRRHPQRMTESIRHRQVGGDDRGTISSPLSIESAPLAAGWPPGGESRSHGREGSFYKPPSCLSLLLVQRPLRRLALLLLPTRFRRARSSSHLPNVRCRHSCLHVTKVINFPLCSSGHTPLKKGDRILLNDDLKGQNRKRPDVLWGAWSDSLLRRITPCPLCLLRRCKRTGEAMHWHHAYFLLFPSIRQYIFEQRCPLRQI